MDLQAPIFTHICMYIRNVRLQMFIQIVYVLDLHFKDQRFESSKLGSSNAIYWWMATDRANIAIANKYKVA